jgi:hypothetical protein
VGLFDKAKPDHLTGTALLQRITRPKDPSGLYYRVRMTLEVHLDDRPPYTADTVTFAPHHKLPVAGTWLPVLVDPRKPDRIRVAWDDVTATGAEAPLPPEGAAAAIPPPAAPPAPAAAPVVPLAVEAVAPAPPVEEAAEAAGPDGLVSQLERLARLRDTGALTDAEYATAKQRLLDGG